MTNLFIRLARYFRSHQAAYWLSMVALFAFVVYFAAQIHLEEDINKLMPSSKNEDGTTKLAFADLKIKDKVFLLFEGKDVGKLSAACDEFVDSLLAQDKDSVIGDIFYRMDEDLMPDGIDYLSTHLPAYIDTAAYARFDTLLTREHFVRQMQKNHADMTGEFGEMFPELIQMDPMGMRDVLAEQMAPLMNAGAYKTIDNHFFVPDSTVCIAFITPRYSSTNTGQGSAMFRMMNKQIEQFAKSHPNVRISYHGTPASGYYNSTQIKHDLTTTIAGALLLVLLLLLYCFRRWDTIPLLLLPIAFGTLFGLTMMYWLKGEFSLLALGIGGVVLGVAMSYVLHVMIHHQYVSDTEQLLRDQVKPVLLGCITTIGSFAGLLFVNTDLLRDFGLFAGFAILGTTLFSLAYLPQMLSKRTNPQAFKWLDRINAYPIDRKRPLLIGLLLVTMIGVGAYIAGGTHFDADMYNLSYEAEITKHSDRLLREKTYTGDKTQFFASQGRTMEEAIDNFALLDHKLDSLQRIGLVKSYTRTNQLLIPLKVQQQRIDAWHRYWTPERQATVRKLINETAPQAGLRPEAFDTFFEVADADYQPDALYKAGIIPEGYLSTLTEHSYGGDYLVFTSVRCQNDSVRSSNSDYTRICDAVASNPHLLVLDTYYYTTDTLMQMSSDFDILQWLSMAFVFVVLLLSFHFNFRQALLGFAPILLSWLFVLGVMNLFGVQFNLISIIISTFIFGIGVDYSIFVMNGLIQGNLQYHKTAVLLSAIILIITVSSMLLAQHPAIRSVGFSTLVGLLSAVILSYILQPAVFRWLNRNKQ
ncbi:MAG: MMPL family transporter [Prevotella sp.]|nr:MMPL family transporter [Prevotella sp.]